MREARAVANQGLRDETASMQSSIQVSLMQVVSKEADAILAIIKNFPSNAWLLVDHVVRAEGKIVFSGLGKSGLVAQKLVATFSSLGISSFFLHPNDALHGDLGAIQKNDIFIVLSKSATGDEYDYIVPLVKSKGVFTCLLCCRHGGVAEKADLVILLPLEREACFLNLAPTSSTTVMMAFGDAVAIVASNIKGFSRNDFAKNHPAGALGKRLLLTVRSLMHKVSSLPFVTPKTLFKDVLMTITSKKLGLAIVVDEGLALKGIITDGDLRRACEHGPELFAKDAQAIATSNPKFVGPDMLAYVALEFMEDFNITSLVVVEHGAVVGLVHIHDLIKAGIQE